MSAPWLVDEKSGVSFWSDCSLDVSDLVVEHRPSKRMHPVEVSRLKELVTLQLRQLQKEDICLHSIVVNTPAEKARETQSAQLARLSGLIPTDSETLSLYPLLDPLGSGLDFGGMFSGLSDGAWNTLACSTQFTPELAQHIAKLDWNQVAKNFSERSPAELKCVWTNDFLPKLSPPVKWTPALDVALCRLADERDQRDWAGVVSDPALAEAGSGRVLAVVKRYRDLVRTKASVRMWSKEEDSRLRALVCTYIYILCAFFHIYFVNMCA